MNIQGVNMLGISSRNTLQNKTDNKNVNFEGKFGDKISDFTAKIYGKYIANSNRIRNFAEKASKKADVENVTNHFQVAGSAVTSSAYMISTMKNKDFEKDNARTLAINQCLGFFVPTAGAYIADHYIKDIKKQIEYKYDAIHEHRIAQQKMSLADKKAAMEKLGKKLKAVRSLMGILTFTFIYRYVTPVAITPFANKIGNWVNARVHAKEVAAQQADVAKEIEMKPQIGNNVRTAA